MRAQRPRGPRGSASCRDHRGSAARDRTYPQRVPRCREVRLVVTPRVTRPARVMDTSGPANRAGPSTKGTDMALFMDAHTLEGGVAAADVAAAHQADLETQAPVRRELPALLGRRGGGQDLLPRRGARRRGRHTPCTARPTASSPTRSTPSRRGREWRDWPSDRVAADRGRAPGAGRLLSSGSQPAWRSVGDRREARRPARPWPSATRRRRPGAAAALVDAGRGRDGPAARVRRPARRRAARAGLRATVPGSSTAPVYAGPATPESRAA